MPKSVPTALSGNNDDGEIYSKAAIPHLQDVNDAAANIGRRFKGGIPTLAQRMGVPYSTLQKKLNPNDESHNLSIADAVHVQLVAEQYDILHAMATALFHVSLPMPDSSPAEVSMRLAKVGAEVGDVFRTAQAALEDGQISPRERREITLQVHEAIGALCSFLRVL